MTMQHTNQPATTTRTATDIVDTTWDVDGIEYRVVAFEGLPTMEDAIRLLTEALDCTVLEAEHAFRVICEDGEFITSVHGDIEDLPLVAA